MKGAHRAFHPREMRLAKALAITVALLLAVPGIDVLSGLFDERVAKGDPTVGLDASVVAESPDAFVALDRLEAIAETGGAGVPDVFSEEIGMLQDARDVRANDDGSVVSYLVEEDADRALDRLSSHMESRGWSMVPFGEEGAATFVKSDGRCTWALATCVQIGSATNIVTRCVIA